MLQRIARMPPAKRAAAMRVVAREEWQRCKEDIFYWIDPSRHPITYVYTRDAHPMFRCNHCQDGVAYVKAKCHVHLLNRHHIEANTEQILMQNFAELDTIRPFPMYPYVKPIIECWLREPLMCIEKSRDVLATWMIVTCYTWDALFHKGRQHLFQSEDASKTRELIERVNTLYTNQPAWLKAEWGSPQPKVSEGTTRAGLFRVSKMQSEIIGLPKGADKVRQYHPSGVMSDEAAFNPEAGDTFAAIKPSIQNGGRYTAVSSANPSFFYHLCRDTVEQVV